MEEELRGVKVLVIDDSKTIRRSAENLLSKAGCDVITATEHPHIYSMIVPQPEETAVFDWYRRLDAAIRSKAASTIDIVRELVPEYGISEAADDRSSARTPEQELVERLVN